MTSLHPQNPDAYIEEIKSFSDRSQDDYLLCGVHYQHIARFFRNSISDDGTSTPSGQSELPLNFVTVLDFAGGKDAITTRELATPQEYVDAPTINAYHSQILFLKGYPSGKWLKTLGATFRVDPEFWRRHLAFLQHRDFYDLPPLPSFTNRIVQLRLTTIFTRHAAITRRAVEIARAEGPAHLRRHHLDLERGGRVGESIIRRLDVISEDTFTVEQHISCTIAAKNGGWAGKRAAPAEIIATLLTMLTVALVWLDSGKPLSSHTTDSWIGGHGTLIRGPNSCLPAIQHPAKIALRASESIRPRATNSQATPGARSSPVPLEGLHSVTQSATLFPAQYGVGLQAAHTHSTPLYAIADVFRLAACSSNQFSHLLRSRVDEALRNTPGDESLCLADLRFIKGILDDHLDYLQEVIIFFEGGLDAWSLPRSSVTGAGAASSNSGKQAASEIKSDELTKTTRADLLADFQAISRRMRALAQRCMEGTNTILNGAMLRESQKAIDQAEEVKLLTKVVFVFAPLSFVCSTLSMQFVDLSWPVGLGVFLGLAFSLLATLMPFLLRRSTRISPLRG